MHELGCFLDLAVGFFQFGLFSDLFITYWSRHVYTLYTFVFCKAETLCKPKNVDCNL